MTRKLDAAISTLNRFIEESKLDENEDETNNLVRQRDLLVKAKLEDIAMAEKISECLGFNNLTLDI